MNCYIKKNTKHIREKLNAIDIQHNIFDDWSRPWIAVNYEISISVYESFEGFNNDIDCSEDEDKFFKLVKTQINYS